ncbi:hypothetical protein EPO15_05670 [bacterium]|nr:MAG: hypothetical protein EPO15_05670 [bacterium]
MSLLTEVDALPAPRADRVAPHRYRVVAGRVLAVSEPGHWAFLSAPEYREYLAGLPDAHPRFDELRVKGFLAQYLDFDRLAADAMEGSLLSWEGSHRLVLTLARGRARMSPDTLREAVDFAFTIPGPAVCLELVAADPEAVWPLARFAAEYAARRSEWNGRRSRLWLRTPALPPARRADEYARVGLGLALVRDAAAAPGLGVAAARFSAAAAERAAPASRLVLTWSPKARSAPIWASALRAAGFGSALVSPEAPTTLAQVPAFAAFYAAFLDAAVSDGPPLREEWAAAALRRLPPEGGRPREERGGPLPGVDVSGELCAAPDGTLFASERGAASPDAQGGIGALGALGTTAWEELAAKEGVRALLAAAEGDHHPLCSQCAYKPACTVAPSRHLAAQGTYWGNLPLSPACGAQMAALDALFARLADDSLRESLLGWADSWSLL